MLQLIDYKIIRDSLLFEAKDIKIPLGSFCIFIGKNGSGKSSFFESFFQSKLAKGNILFNNVELHSITNKELPKIVATVGNSSSISEYILVEEYITLGRYVHTNQLGNLSTKDKEIISEFTSVIGITHLLKKRFSEISDGEKQRVAITKALIQETPIVLMDEPTAFLDFPSKQEICELLSQIAKKWNKIIICSTHDIHLSLPYANSVLAIPNNVKELYFHKEAPSIEEILELCF